MSGMEDGFYDNPDGTVGNEENFLESLKKIVLNHTKKLLTHLIYIYLYYLSWCTGGEKHNLNYE